VLYGNGADHNGGQSSRNASSDRLGLAAAYQPSSDRYPTTPEPGGSGSGSKRHSVEGRRPPASYGLARHSKRSSGDSQMSFTGILKRIRNGRTTQNGATPNNATPNNDSQDSLTAPEMSDGGIPSRTDFSRPSSGLFQGNTDARPSSLLRPPIPPPPLSPREPWLVSGQPPPLPPSPAKTDGTRNLDDLLDPRLIMRHVGGGQHSMASLKDHEDYTRPIFGAIANNEARRNSVNADAQSVTGTMSELSHGLARAP